MTEARGQRADDRKQTADARIYGVTAPAVKHAIIEYRPKRIKKLQNIHFLHLFIFVFYFL
jgi:hypothetical protein